MDDNFGTTEDTREAAVLMNRIETALVDSPPRAWLQRSYELPLLERLGARIPGRRVVEIGCGRGVGAELLLERWGAAHVTAIDLDPAMVERARRRLARFGSRVEVRCGTDFVARTDEFKALCHSMTQRRMRLWTSRSSITSRSGATR